MSSVQQPGRAVGEAGARGAPHTPTPTHATPTTVTTAAAAGRQFVSPARLQQQQHDVLAVGSNSNSVNANVIISGSSGLLFPGGGSGGAEDDVPQGAAPLVPISLTLPRPDHQRSSNLYVDTPFPHRPAPRRPRVLPTNTASSPGAVTAGSGAPSSPSSQRSPSPVDSSPPHSSSTSNLLQNAGLPSVHTTGIRSFVNPNNTSVNSSSKGSTDITKYNSYSRSSLRSSSSNVRCSTSSSNVKNSKLSSSSFSFSTSTSRLVSGGGGGVIQSQPSSGGGVRGGRSSGGGGGGKGGSFSNTLLLDTKSCLELRGGGGGGVVGGAAAVAAESIICSSCGRCRCEACRSPRPPPSAWLCAGKCLCSPASCVDCVSCAWCVKAALYHCGEGEGSGWRGSSSRRCCCGGVRARRWGLWACVAVGALPLPCLLCYFPLTALRQLLERGYQRCTSHGCRCNAAPALSPPSPTPPPARPPQSLLPFPASPTPPSLVL